MAKSPVDLIPGRAPAPAPAPTERGIPHPSQKAAAIALLSGFSLLMMGNGMQQSLIGVRAELAGFAPTWTTLIMASYFAGFLLGTKVGARWLALVGHIRVFAALASLASAVSLLHALAVVPPLWLLLRFTSGVCMAGIYVVVESWLNSITTNATRGRLMASYMIVTMGSVGIGQLLLRVADPKTLTLFILASVLISVSLLPISLSTTSAPPVSVPEPLPLRTMTRLMPAGVVAAALVGVSQGAMVGMAPVFATRAGMDSGQVARFLFMPMLGTVILQFPIGRWSDHVRRQYALLLVSAASAVLALSMAVVDPASLVALGLMFLVGGTVYSSYSVALAFLNDGLTADQLLSGSAAYVFISGFGAMCGPLIAGASMNLFGNESYFVALATAPALLALYLLARRPTSKDTPPGGQRRWVPLAARGGVVAASVLGRRGKSTPRVTAV